MIICHSRKYVLLKTRKTASTSLEIALSRYCGPEDVITPSEFDEDMRRKIAGIGAQNYLKRQTGLKHALRRAAGRSRPEPLFTPHMTAVDVRARLGEERWNDYFKFTIVRNPFDRMLSRYHWTMANRPAHRERWGIDNLGAFLRYRAEYVNENWLIYTAGDRLLVDDVVRFEHFEEDLARISERIGLDHNVHDEMKTIKAKSGFRPKDLERPEIGPEEEAIIASLCSREMELFGYGRPEPAVSA